MDRRHHRVRGLRRAAWLIGTSLALGCAHPGPPSPHSLDQVGLASYYSPKLAGRQTASGERYDPKALTAAHRSLPFGSIVRIERLSSGGGAQRASVRVCINDRGPFVRGRIIDLSDAAAREIGMLREGVVPVRLQLVQLRASSCASGIVADSRT